MPADVNNDQVFNEATYTCFEQHEVFPGGEVVNRPMPYCLVQLRDDPETSAFWMVPSPEGPMGWSGTLGLDATHQPRHLTVQMVPGSSNQHPAGSDSKGPLTVFQWSDPGV